MCGDPTGGVLDFCSIYRFFDDLLGSSGVADRTDWLAFALAGSVLAFIAINGLVAATALYTWFERRALARFQARLGPNRWGPFGLLQPMADLVKLITKEDTVPDGADRPVFLMSPVLFVVPALIVIAVIPFGDNPLGSFLGRLNIGVLFILGITSANSVVIFMAGWASRNKYAMFGAMRGVAMLVSYEVPMALSVTGVLIVAGSMSLFDIVEAQHVPFLLVQPLGFFVFLTASLAEISRSPLDQIEAESELGAGYHTEYSGIKFAIFQLAEFMAPLVTALIITTVFLGGTRGFSPVPGMVWLLLKVFGVVFVMLWARATWPRLRVDQIMALAWKALFFMAIINMFLVAVEVQLLGDEAGKLTTEDMWLMAAINWVVAIAIVVLIANLMGQRRLKRPTPVPSPLADMRAEAD